MSDDPLPPARTWYVYLVRAENQALYCGISDDPARRFAQHRSGRGARFFASSPAQALVYVEACGDKSAALRREIQIKKLPKRAKEALVLARSGTLPMANSGVLSCPS
ncbi:MULTISPECIES: GIY-YIG nuclease family protein [unclassified Pseudomonas]|uniref:GIY-YIG nuclease family protein n=1 Tax=unclassified Pseudomonas TaxID=196821 RepID=UPI00235F011B|nr:MULTISPECIES: GIY-YIG nuclease family protein [unclassified Pseudomonas]